MEDVKKSEFEKVWWQFNWIRNRIESVECRVSTLESKPIFTGTIHPSTANPREHRTEAPVNLYITEGPGLVRYCDEPDGTGTCLRCAWGFICFHHGSVPARAVCRHHAIEHLRRIADSIERNG